MKKLFSLVLLIASFAVVACNTKKEQESVDPNLARIDSLQNALNQSQHELGDLTATVSQVMDGFAQINEAEGNVNQMRVNREGIDKAAIQKNMQLIKDQLKLNRELIGNLKQQLKENRNISSADKAKLENIVASLQQQLDEKTAQINQLQAQLAEKDLQIAEQSQQIQDLSNNVQDLNQQNEQKAQVMAAQDKELHTAYYVFGTKKELRQQHILESGDVLKNNNFNKDYFTRIDQRTTKVIKLYSKKAELKTSHPAGSYSLDKDADEQYTLRITNPQAFWSVSKYLVIIVK